jgi:hypothetical protein
MVAAVLLAAVMTVCLQMLTLTAAQHRALEDRQTAIQETANLMERLCARAWADLTAESVRDVQLSEQARRSLPDAELEIKLTSRPTTSSDGEPDAKRIAVALHWQHRAGQPLRHVQLVAWRYRGIDD